MSKKSDAGKFALAAGIGAALGAIGGLLFAPKSGKETRADIKEKAGEAKDFTVKKAHEVKDFAGKEVEKAKQAGHKLFSKHKDDTKSDEE
ncbi:MAG: YtxH domain-containing protein [Candidatus Nomurabacteria bacterium]|jgi:gas vesicle protein|nr:YtxH domain-containing protein [Candidatus Nomurabacteria bacterium]